MNNIINHNDYDKITDDIYQIGYNCCLRLTVSLSASDRLKNRIPYHTEYSMASKYIDTSNSYTIRRNFSYYLSIENIFKPENETKAFIMFRTEDMYRLLNIITEAIKWYTDDKFSSLYARKNNKIIITTKIDPLIVDNLLMQKTIKFEPSLIEYDMSQPVPSCRIYLDSETNYIDIPVDKLIGLKYILDRLDIFGAAQNMINYLGRPEYGTNLKSLDFNKLNSSTKGRTIGGIK